MAEYRTFFLAVKLCINTCVPFFAMEWGSALTLCYYALTLVFPFGLLVYIMAKKRLYFKKYLCKPFIPSLKLILFAQACDLSTLVLLYRHILVLSEYSTRTIACAIAHSILSVLVYALIFCQKERNRMVISYTRHRYRLGIMARDIGGIGGLKEGQPVEIVRETSSGYMVKDSRRQDYELRREDIGEILDIV